MKVAVGVFAKTIGLSEVKTRLAAEIGKAQAESFYRLSVACIARMAGEAAAASNHEICPHWVLAEPDGPEHFEHGDFPRSWTGEGGLGARLANVSEMLFESHDVVILIGTDSPQLTSERLLAAIDRLLAGSAKAVAGPATDGGFYLFGSTVPVAREIWEAVRYSCETTLAELCSGLAGIDVPVAMLAEEQDVDEVADLATLSARLAEHIPALTEEQRQLLRWLDGFAGLPNV